MTSPLNVLVAGMHRSGTSAIAMVLERVGLSAGRQSQPRPVAIDNPEGFPERSDVMQLNDDLLQSLGWTWDTPDPDPPWRLPSRPALVNRGRALVKRHLQGPGPWYVKDPRLCLLLPWWRQITLDRFVLVVPVRPVAEVSWSLAMRNDFPLELGVALWSAYLRHLASGAQGLPVITVDYAALTQHPTEVVPQLIAAVEAELDIEGLDRESGLQAVIPLLRRATQPVDRVPREDLVAACAQLQSLWPADPVGVLGRFAGVASSASWWEVALLELHRRYRRAQVNASALAAEGAEYRAEAETLRNALHEVTAELEHARNPPRG